MADFPDAVARIAGGEPFSARLLDALLADVGSAEHPPLLVDLLSRADSTWRPWLALTLGVLTEGASTTVRAAVEAGYDGYRTLLRAASTQDERLALLYLLAHFPARDGFVDELMSSAEVSTEDATRVARCASPAGFPLGRVWPSPAHWELDADEKLVDKQWRAGLNLTDEANREIGDLETQSILAFLGAQAEDAAARAGVR